MDKDFSAKVVSLLKAKVFLGGPEDIFQDAGKRVMLLLVSEGLTPSKKLLDIGCGCLRCGYWLISFLEAGSYFGIEPNRNMLNAGRKIMLTEELESTKNPVFDCNEAFDLDVFEAKFDFVLARSIWTHTSKLQIEKMLDQFVKVARPGAVFLTSFHPAKGIKDAYEGTTWVGKSHKSDIPGMVAHLPEWIGSQCEARGLGIELIDNPMFAIQGQVWLGIRVLGD